MPVVRRFFKSGATGQYCKPPKRTGRPRVLGPFIARTKTPPSVPPSLPPVAPDATALVPPLIPAPPSAAAAARDTNATWYLPDDSKVRRYALQIIAMRLAGMEDPEIAASMNIAPKSIKAYVYRAGKNGWLDLDNAAERIEYQLMHKVVRNLDEALDSKANLKTGMPIRTDTAMKVAEGTVFKRFSEPTIALPPQTIVAVKIETPAGPPQTMREDTAGGTPAHIDADAQVQPVPG